MQDLSAGTGLDDVANDLYYTICRAIAYPNAAELAKPLEARLDECDATDADHKKKLRRAITKADAMAVGARLDVESFCSNFQKVMLGVVNQDRTDPRFVGYYPQAASTLVKDDRAGLRKWLSATAETLGKDTDKALASHAKQANVVLTKWDTAEANRDAATAKNKHHGATVREPLRAAINDARRVLHADLVKLATKEKRGKKWPDSFFRQAPRGKKGPVEEA